MTRLIDAEVLKNDLITFFPDECLEGITTKTLFNQILTDIDTAPTVEPDMEFAKWVTKMIFGNNEVEDFDFELFSELACRKLEKIGLVEKTESEWTKKGEEE